MMMLQLLLQPLLMMLVLSSSSSAVHAVSCPAHAPGYFAPNGGGDYTFYPGAAPPTNSKYQYVLEPDFLSCDELLALNQYCVARINRYRTGELKFTGNKADPALGKPKPLQEATANARCEAAITMGDFGLMGGIADCGGGAHKTAWACPAMRGAQSQNACCPRNVGTNFASVALALDQCLQQMWDEGLPHNAGGVTGHWLNMKNPDFALVSCGFAFAKSVTGGGRNVVNMQQNFADSFDVQEADGQFALKPEETPTLAVTAKPTTPKPTTPKPTTLAPTTKRPTSRPTTLSPTTKRPTSTPTTLSPTTKWPTVRPNSNPQQQQPIDVVGGTLQPAADAAPAIAEGAAIGDASPPSMWAAAAAAVCLLLL